MSGRLKRLTAPRSWSIKRKENVWTTKPTPGPHAIEGALPLVIVVRDVLKYCNTSKEAQRIISSGEILVDGSKAKKFKRPVGFMDVISIPKTRENYRMLLNTKGKLTLMNIASDVSKWKLARIENKTIVKGGKTQLNLHDGRCVILEKNMYKTGDVLKIAIPSQKILDVYEMKKDNTVMITGGRHQGEIGTIEAYDVSRSPKENVITLKDGRTTVKRNVFVVGKKKPEIEIPEVNVI